MRNKCTALALALLVGLPIWQGCRSEGEGPSRSLLASNIQSTVDKLVVKSGGDQRDRISRGVRRAASLWPSDNGSGEDFVKFCLDNFIADPALLDTATDTIERNFEILRGHLHQIDRELNAPFVLDRGEPTEVDRLFADSVPEIDYFRSKLAFFITLNFPRYSLEEKLQYGEAWSRKDWAKARIGDLFDVRIPDEIREEQGRLSRERRAYFNRYFIRMDHVLTPDHRIIFPENARLNCHNGLRDDIKGEYSKPGGLERQRLITKMIGRIADQTIPKAAIDGAEYYWEPEANGIFVKQGRQYVGVTAEPEGNDRYRQLLSAFHVQRELDPFYPEAPSFILRTFESRQMPERDVERLIVSVLESPMVDEVVALIQKRVGRKLEPFDIWYSGFQAQGSFPEDRLDRMLKAKYPDPAAFQADLPAILKRLGFSAAQAEFLGSHVVVDPVRTGGHATGAAMRGDSAHLRTVFGPGGLDYKGFRVGMHELGHTVHQNLSLYGMDHYFLSGVPMSGFAEAIAELFAYRNIEGLGLGGKPDPREQDIQALANFWYVYEMGGQALTDMKIWHWLYDHPETTAEQLKLAVLEISRGLWRRYYAGHFGDPDSALLSIYTHMISGGLYLHSYFLGNIIMFQLYDYLGNRDFASELDRMCKQGALTPDLWMKGAVGTPISTKPLLKAVGEALRNISE